QQHLHGVEVTGACRRHEGRFPVAVRGVGVSARFEQRLEHAGAADGGRLVQRRDAVSIGCFRVGARANQLGGRRHIVPVGGPVQGRHAFHVGGVHVDVLREQRADRRQVAILHRGGESSVGGGGERANGGDTGGESPTENPKRKPVVHGDHLVI